MVEMTHLTILLTLGSYNVPLGTGTESVQCSKFVNYLYEFIWVKL